MSDLAPDNIAALFPELAPYLNDAANGGGPDPLPSDPTHGGVTDEAVQNFINQRYRPLDPRFQSGHGAPPPRGGVEGAPTDTGDAPGRIERPEGAPSEPSSPEQAAPQAVPPPATEAQPTGDEVVGGVEGEGQQLEPPEPDDGEPIPVPRTRVEAWQQFETLLDQDPRLQQLITDYLVTGQVNQNLLVQPGQQQQQAQPTQQQPVATQPQPTQQQPGALTPPPDLDLDDPTVAALWQIVENQNQQLGLIQAQISTQYDAQVARQQAETNGLVNRAVTSFQQQHDLNDAQISKIREVAGRLNLIPVFMSGRDPFTGAPVRPDPIAAVDRALEIAYNQMPDMVQANQDRILAQRRADDERKRKASSLSGSSGSTPRTQPAPTTPEERRAALVGEVGQMMNGSWSQPE